MSRDLKWVNGDIYIPTGTGRPVLIEGIEKASQDVAYQLMREYDGDQGSELAQVETPAYATLSMMISLISTKVSDVITRLKRLQYEELRKITDDELIDRIISLRVWRMQNLDFAFYLALETASSEPVTKNYVVSLSHQFPDKYISEDS